MASSNSSLAPANQMLSIIGPDGPVQFSLIDLTKFVRYGMDNAISPATQVGASLVLLLVLLLLTHNDKRRSMVFILNVLSLVFNFIRCLCEALYYTSAWWTPYVFFTADFSGVPASAYANSIMANVFTVLVLMCVETSLVFQVLIASSTTRRVERFWLMFLTVAVALVAIGFRFAFVVQGNMAIMNAEAMLTQWLSNAAIITETISICFFCAIFLWKLGIAIRRQRTLGIKKFGPMQAIFIMAGQTLLIPGKQTRC